MKKIALTLLCLAPLAVQADVLYRVQARPNSNTMTVSITTPASGSLTKFQISKWAPGSYRYADHQARVKDVTAKASNGKALDVGKVDETTWAVDSIGQERVTITYTVPSGLNSERIHYTGPSTYMYVMGRKEDKCRLIVDIPAQWKSTCGLDGKNNNYTAPDYDTLADNPVTLGNYVSDTYTYQGIPHEIVYFAGDPSIVDRQQVVKECLHITKAQSHFWGGLPFKKYVWHFNLFRAPDGGWGLEHLSSTTIGLSNGLGRGIVSVLSHEYFHAWNVKRIRSSVLGPFDYQVLPKTGALWWLEGVTDYYASMLRFRYGRFEEDFFFSEMLSSVGRTLADADRLEVSPYDSSYRVSEASNGQGNSAGFGVNYYNTGWVLGMMLDIEMRRTTNNKYSLDDVSRELYKECKNDNPGFEEDRIREILGKFGGDHMTNLYDEWVMKPGDLPVNEILAHVGLTLKDNVTILPDVGATIIARQNGNVNVVTSSWNDQLERNDKVLEINGKSMEVGDAAKVREAYTDAMQSLKANQSVTMKIQRGEDTMTIQFTTRERRQVSRDVVEISGATAAQKKLRTQWYQRTKIPF